MNVGKRTSPEPQAQQVGGCEVTDSSSETSGGLSQVSSPAEKLPTIHAFGDTPEESTNGS